MCCMYSVIWCTVVFWVIIILANFWKCCGGGVIARGDLFPIHLYFFLPFWSVYVWFIDIPNERKTSYLHQDCLYLYNNKETYMYWVLFIVLLDLPQGPIVQKSSLFSIIWQFVGHEGENFCLGGPAGGDGMWGVMALCRGCDPRLGGESATMHYVFIHIHAWTTFLKKKKLGIFKPFLIYVYVKLF